MFFNSRNRLLTFFLVLASPLVAQAACTNTSTAIYSFVVEMGDECGSSETSNANSILNELKTNNLKSLAGINYTGVEPINFVVDWNKVAAYGSFPNPGNSGDGTILTLKIPELGVDKVFHGVTRDKSRSLLADFVKKEILDDILALQVANSPYSPIAGPSGLIPTMTTASFNENFTDSATNIAAPSDTAAAASRDGKTQNLSGVAFSYGTIKVLDNTTNVTTLPLSYTFRNDIDPRRQLVISLPLTLIDSDGAKSYEGALGAAYRMPMSDNWTLAPGARIGMTGSKDLATLATILATSVTSTYIWELNNFDIAVGNQIGYNRSVKVSAGEYTADPGINSLALRNGVLLSQPVTLGGHKMSIEYSLIDTHYMGTKFYVDNSQEFGITFGTNKHAYSARSFLRGGLSFIRGKDTDGVTANLGYWF